MPRMTSAERCLRNLESRSSRIERARVMGDYYRDLANNYAYYHSSSQWPSAPGTTYSQAIVLESIERVSDFEAAAEEEELEAA